MPVPSLRGLSTISTARIATAILARALVAPALAALKKTFPARVRAIQAEIAGLKDAADPYHLALERDRDLLGSLLKSAQAFSLEAAAPPGITCEGEVRLWLADQEVDVLHMGDLFFNGLYPFIDALAGGSGRGHVRNLDRILALVPPDRRRMPSGPSAWTSTRRSSRGSGRSGTMSR